MALPALGSVVWPTFEAWEGLRAQVGERLLRLESAYTPARVASLTNPFTLEDIPGCTQSTGWLGAWSVDGAGPCVAPESVADVVAAVSFARDQGIRLAVKGTGHDYLGRSNGESRGLLLWTHRMRQVQHVRWRGIDALSVAAGARWLEVYGAAQALGKYAQGGGCTSVGAAGGHIQGSGFGSFSRRYGTSASGVLEYEVVLADGSVVVCNDTDHPDLFWALRGGGGGTFGVVTRVTIRLHDQPPSAGLLSGTIYSKDFRGWLDRFARFYPTLCTEQWGEQIAIGEDSVEVGLVYSGLTPEQAYETWRPMLGADESTVDFGVKPLDPAHLWDLDWFQQHYPDFATPDPNSPYQWWWSSNTEEVSAFLCSYQSRWLPALAPDKLSELFYRASRENKFHLHLNKGLLGASAEALERTRATCLNPACFEASCLVIAAANQPAAFPGIAGHEPDLAAARVAADRVSRCMELFREATPGAGTYANEADYFEKDWQQAFWGPHYARLLEVKQRYDPGKVFRVHHGVGSESAP